jgi:hypothetical protein
MAEKNKGGRPTSYESSMPKRAFKLALLGVTDKDIAEQFLIGLDTFYEWKNKHPQLKAAIVAGRKGADSRVAKAMYRRACGFSHPEEVIKVTKDDKVIRVMTSKYYPPDVEAGKFWLTNRQRALWKSVFRTEHTGADGKPIELNEQQAAMAAITDEEMKLITSIGLRAKAQVGKDKNGATN